MSSIWAFSICLNVHKLQSINFMVARAVVNFSVPAHPLQYRRGTLCIVSRFMLTGNDSVSTVVLMSLRFLVLFSLYIFRSFLFKQGKPAGEQRLAVAV